MLFARVISRASDWARRPSPHRTSSVTRFACAYYL